MDIHSIALGIIEHAIIPNAKASNIDISVLIEEIVKMNHDNIETIINNNNNNMDISPEIKVKRGRGRPKGVKNKNKNI
jgi:hypothetical protein